MTLNAGDTGYGSVPGRVVAAAEGDSESATLLVPDPVPAGQWRPMTMEELQLKAGGPGWRKVRCYLVLLFWLAWLAMLATSIAIIATSPRPQVTPLRWWQKCVFYQLQPELLMEQTGGVDALCGQLPHLRSMGMGALILKGLFAKAASPLNVTVTGEVVGTLPQVQHLLTESNKAGLKVVLDVCDVEVFGAYSGQGNMNDTSPRSLHFWLEQGVAGLAICDTDAAYSEKTLLAWRSVFKLFSTEDQERILIVKQTGEVLPPLTKSSQNATLVDVVMKSILPASTHIQSTQEVANAVERHLQTPTDIWTSWTVGGQVSRELKNLLLVLIMTLPGSPTVQYDEEIRYTQNISQASPSHEGQHSETSDSPADKEKMRRSAVALFTSLSHSRAREEALLYGTFTFLSFNSSSNVTDSPPPILAFLRSWGCVHFLVLLNIGPEPHALDPAWAPSLPEAGVFVSSTGTGRLGSTSLYTLTLQAHEAIVIKLFEAGSYA